MAATMDDKQALVAQKLLALEGELSFITQPGRIPPRAAVVAGLRKEISTLRSELANPGSVENIDLTMPKSLANFKAPAAPKAMATPPPVVPSVGSKAAMREMKSASGARNALLAIEKKLGSQANAAPLSEKAKTALEMIEGNMSSVKDASKNLTEFETLQVENALLRTRLEVVMERKRHLSQLTLALRRGLVGEGVGGTGKGKGEAEKAHAAGETVEKKTAEKKTADEVVYTF